MQQDIVPSKQTLVVLAVLASLLMALVLPASLIAAPLTGPDDGSYQSIPFSQAWTNTGLITANDDWSGVPGIVGFRGDDLTASTGTDPQTLLADDSPGVIDVIANQSNPNTLTSGGVAEFEITDSVVALQGSGTADAPYLLIYLNTTGYQSINVAYNLRDVDGSTDDAVQPVALHFRVGTAGSFTNVPAAFVADATSGPSLATLVTPVSVTLPASADDEAQVQLRIMTANASGSDEWVGIDDISITGTPSSVDLPPTVTAVVPLDGATNVPVDAAVEVTFSEPVAISGTVEIDCTGGTQNVTPTGGPTNFDLPHSDFGFGESCTVTILASQVTDQDGDPDNMAGDYSWSFETTSGCFGPSTAIHDIQGDGLVSPVVGQQHSVEALVVADYQSVSSIRGFYMEEPDGDQDANPATSEGLFIYDDNLGVDVAVGDYVRVTGFVSEFEQQTQLSSISAVTLCDNDPTVATPIEVTLPFSVTTFPERYEGMWVTFPQTLTVSENYNLGRGGILTLSNGRLQQPTNVVLPGTPANDFQADNNRNMIVLDDNNLFQNPDPIIYPPPGLSALNSVRSGDEVSQIDAVLTEGDPGWSSAGIMYRLWPNAMPTFTPANPRPAAPDPVRAGGSLRVSSFNVLNYFLTLDDGVNDICGPDQNMECRGADSASEFTRQRDKLLQALYILDADVLGLMELENTPGVEPLANLVDGLNALTAPGTYDYIDAGTFDPGDVIKVGLIYKPGVVQPVGDFAVLNSLVDPLFDTDLHRPALAQTFEEVATNGRFTAVVNHLKSKGCSGATGLDTDQGDGQACFNHARTVGANAELAWLATDPTNSGDPDFIIMGDLNAYSKEDPIAALEAAGYTNLEAAFEGPDAYSYVFFAQAGSLDHSMASASMVSQVSGATTWHVNADEPSVLDYNEDFKSPGQIISLYNADQYRTSDHDPLLIGLNLTPTEPPNIEVDPQSLSSTQLPDTQVVQTLTISNTGGMPLEWQIYEEPVAGPPEAVQPVTRIDSQATMQAELTGEDNAAPTATGPRDMAAAARAQRMLGTTGLLLIPESTNDRVMAFDPFTGNLVDADFIPADPDNLSTPIHAILSASGNSILVSDQLDDVVQEYGLDGSYIGIFAPAGGVNNAILDNIRGISLRNGADLLVTVGGGANDDAVAQFDTSGTYTGNFVANGAGGLDSPFDVYGRLADWLVGGITSDAIHTYDLSGAYVNNLTAINTFPEQIAQAANSNVLVANFSGTEEGVVEYLPDGTLVGIYDPAALGGYRGVYELGNGNLLTTTGSGVHEIDRAGNLVQTKISDVSGRFIEYVAPQENCTNPADVPWLSTDPISGTTAAGQATDVDVTFDSTGLAAGTYNANLCITSNDPGTEDGFGGSAVVVPVSLTVPSLPAPAIVLTKTVGTTPGVCAATTEITVPAGAEVYYCYQAENTGDFTFNFHDLEDSELGVILDDFPYALAPGALSPQVIVPETINITTTNCATWTAFTSLGGYVYDDGAPYDYSSIATFGTALGLDDDGEANVTMPFPFSFYGVTSSDVRIGNNGGILFDATSGEVGFTNATLPNAAHPLTIFPFWDDIDSDTGDVYYATVGTAPNRRFIVEWFDRPHFSNVGSATFQVVLYEGTNQIKFLYADVDFGNPLYDNGASATVGLNKDATMALQYSFDQPVITDQMAILWTPAELLSASDSACATVNVEYAQIDVDPLNFDVKVGLGQTTTRTLDIANVGDAPLDWIIDEEDTTAATTPTMPNANPADALDAVQPGDGTKTETSAPAPLSAWRAPEALLWDNGPLTTHPGGGAGGADASVLQTAVGLNIYGFGHALSTGFRVADDFTVTGGGWDVSQITFFAYQTGSTTTSTINHVNLRIWDGPPGQVGSTVVFGDTATDRLASTTWSNIYRSIDTDVLASNRPIMADTATVNTYLPPGTYWVDWQTGGTLGSGPWAPPVSLLGQTGKPGANGVQFDPTLGTWNPLVDSGTAATIQDLPFIIEGEFAGGSPPCLVLSDITWLTVTPDNGTTAAGGSTPVQLDFDSTGLPAGTYTGNLCISSNDPDAGPGNGTDLVIVPITLEVNPPTAVVLTDLATESSDQPVIAVTAVISAFLAAALAAVFVTTRRRRLNR